MKGIIILIAVTLSLNVSAQYVTIPDTSFVHYLQSHFPSAMNGSQMDTTNVYITTTQTLSANSSTIQDFTGIRYFKSLKDFDCSNITTSFGVYIPNLPDSLLGLNCNSTLILISLPTLPPTLKYLSCYYSGLSHLPSLPNSLISVDCGFNAFTTLPPLPNSLIDLYCSYGELDSLPALPSSLQNLTCDHQYPGLTHLPVLPNSLQLIDCSSNQISCFPIFPSSLSSVDIDNNPYNCLPNYALPAMNSYTTTPLCGPGNSNGCPFSTSIKENLNRDIVIYPSPTSEQFFIEADIVGNLSVDLYDVNGRRVLSKDVNSKSNINVTGLSEGVYSLIIRTTDNLINKKIIIAR